MSSQLSDRTGLAIAAAGAALGVVGLYLVRRCKSKEDFPISPERNRAPPRPTLYPLRPDVDPRIDQACIVRYDAVPEKKTGTIMVVLPGGNYDECDVSSHEGQPVAQWLAELGITAVVLQYRCVSQGHYWPAQYDDYETCITVVKSMAADWGCDPDRFGVIGFSAGGHLASFAATQAQRALKPRLQILVYPAIDPQSPSDGSCQAWHADMGYPPNEACTYKQVHGQVAPAFMASLKRDKCCPAKENGEAYALALQKYGVKLEHVWGDDEHGCGLSEWWTTPCEEWLRSYGWAK